MDDKESIKERLARHLEINIQDLNIYRMAMIISDIKKTVEWLDESNESAINMDRSIMYLDWKSAQHLFQRYLLNMWLETGQKKRDIADKLNIQRTYLSKLIRQHELR